MTSRSTWLLIWVLLGLAPAAALAQLTGTLVADPTRAQATVDVQGTVTVAVIGTLDGGAQANTIASGTIDVVLTPSDPPFDTVTITDMAVAFEDVQLNLPLTNVVPFFPSIDALADLRNTSIVATEPMTGFVGPGGRVVFVNAPLRFQTDLTVTAGLFGRFPRAIDEIFVVDLNTQLTDLGDEIVLVIDDVIIRSVRVPPADLPFGILDASFTFSLDFRQIAFAGMLGVMALPGDADGDGDIDLADFLSFLACLRASGPGQPIPDGCEDFDFDHDGDIDLADYVTFQSLFTGSF